MFLTDRFIYIHLQKTGGTRIREILSQVTDGHSAGRKHGYLNEKPADKLVFGSIRNPYEWYVSLWAFGCEGRGGVLSWLKDDPTWQRVYANANDPELFRLWLKMIYSQEYVNKMQNGYNHFNLNHCIGLMTWHYAYLYLTGVGIDGSPKFRDYDDFSKYEQRHNIVDYWLRLEDLAGTIYKALIEAGCAIDKKNLQILCTERSNMSNHLPYRDYYDLGNIVLVQDKERLIFERFGYNK